MISGHSRGKKASAILRQELKEGYSQLSTGMTFET